MMMMMMIIIIIVITRKALGERRAQTSAKQHRSPIQ